ncbi:hypothetical protein EB796_016385 [Bugula neritina]|uniref:LicD/FKTN/FKRP nucleotidyltransferase domain-containing protein n=1 Tax=Bugula neritina TaxID=10212 RepID=A0A7J7JGE2_BUGNE|nr:hypothetical protein EB796_016385 [Bugula neritina]
MQVPLKGGMTSVSGFALWFLELVKLKKIILSCPDSMSYVDNIDGESERGQWLDLVKHSQVEEIYLGQRAHFQYGCNEANTRCPADKPPSLALSHCCMNELSLGVKTVMRACKDHNMICELNDGTLLGSLKFEGTLPWEVDADLSVDSNNFTAVRDILAPYLKSKNLSFRDSKTYYRFYTPMRWFIEIFSISSTDTSRLSKAGISPTRVLLDGEYVATPQSPGLFGRNRYSSEMYQHANHWRKRGGTSSWQFYEAGKFAECVKPGHQSCLDQFVADGSLRFNQNLLRG